MEQSLNAVVEAKIKAKLQKGMTNVSATMSKLMEEGKISRDFTFEVGTAQKGKDSKILFLPENPKKVVAELMLPKTGPEKFTFNNHSVTQLAEKLKVPTKYLLELLEGNDWQRALAYEILNTTNQNLERNKVLIRAVGSEVRGVLSDSYRRLDSHLIFDAHVKSVFEAGGQLADGFMDDSIVMVESMLPKPISIQTKLNGEILLAFGARLSTFDYGGKAQVLSSIITNGICLNGAVRENIMRTVHIGAKLPDDMSFSRETYELDSQTTASAIRDLTKDLYGVEVIKKRLQEIQMASETIVDPGTMLKNLYQSMKIFKGEENEIGKIMMRNDPMQGVQGESTLWKLAQGITAYANEEAVGERRRLDLQEIAGNLFKVGAN